MCFIHLRKKLKMSLNPCQLVSAAIVSMSTANCLKCTLSNNYCPEWPECLNTSWVRIAGDINRTIMIMNRCQTHLWWPTFHSWQWSWTIWWNTSSSCVIFIPAFLNRPGNKPTELWTKGVPAPYSAFCFSEPSDFWRQFVTRSYWSLCICWCSVGLLWRLVLVK